MPNPNYRDTIATAQALVAALDKDAFELELRACGKDDCDSHATGQAINAALGVFGPGVALAEAVATLLADMVAAHTEGRAFAFRFTDLGAPLAQFLNVIDPRWSRTEATEATEE